MSKDVSRLIGYEFEPYRFVVERGKIREFALAIEDDNPIYVDRAAAAAAGFSDVTIPPTFPTVIDMWGGPDFFALVEALQLDLLKVLHGEQEYEYLGDIYPGDEIQARTRVADAKTKAGTSGGMHLITLETRYANQRGETVLISRSTIVERF
ncbi:MaoC family dehydratase [Brevibacillus sp. SYP-B805]|uniref:MaoC family dehydratase N-terminal domain-containing protein n=1 Tax=Brevibacillus sp. SYP-B805 TaxID=1578199 RepID=UPI0013EDF0B4|nr:MaoC family dehydratase N-terminal domain-containing protein [Brevibacillus sp. SYP-B805]NGQ93592.1 MaoC family dehydratase [Brevibacillus sp. SYP-B805]